MIIGINGKIGSGKDTIGLIIQGLFLTRKNELSEIKKFAGKLKTIATLLTGIPIEMFEDQEFKKTNLPDEWSTKHQSGRNKVSIHMTVRAFLQRLGTEAMRDGLHTNVWVNALFADYKPFCNKFESKMLQTGGNYTSSICSDCNCFPNWIITDMRFPNEMEAVVERKGITIRVTRPVKKSETTPRLHPSETSLDSAKFDYEIINDGTIEDLIEKVKEILTKSGII